MTIVRYTTDAVQARLHRSSTRIRKFEHDDEDDRDQYTRQLRANSLNDHEATARAFEEIINTPDSPPVVVAGFSSHYTFTAFAGHTISGLSAAVTQTAEARYGPNHRQRLDKLEVVPGIAWPNEIPSGDNFGREKAFVECLPESRRQNRKSIECGKHRTMATEGTCNWCGHGDAHTARYVEGAPPPLRSSRLGNDDTYTGNATITNA